jgi:hypothetical protein
MCPFSDSHNLIKPIEPCHTGYAPTGNCFGYNPYDVWLEMLGRNDSNPPFCLVGGVRYGIDDSFHSGSGSYMS